MLSSSSYHLLYYAYIHKTLKTDITDTAVFVDRSSRVMIRTSANFIRHVGDGVQHIDGHFTSHPQHVASGRYYDIDQLRSELDLAVENFNARGSGFNIDVITDFTVVLTLFRPLSGPL